jgi:hypothetical protein
MPTRITHFLHDSIQTGSQALGTAFSTADVHVHDMTEYLPAMQKDAANFRGIVPGRRAPPRSPSGSARTRTGTTRWSPTPRPPWWRA